MAYLKLTQIKLFVQVLGKIYFICFKNHVVMIGVLRGGIVSGAKGKRAPAAPPGAGGTESGVS
ncbi:MAG: hypothetical protein E7E12_26460 [Klebsiella sp.]|uniref:hypothetical protein n=1 Tax=Klebsiella sp. TaxID=576 RepID=UPI0027F02C56|nr:hypothetical protein [Klebsiella sp.]EKT9718424.1 hypothetical protein [Klebsiella variicola]ELA0870083.1 hypothetical protein [Klebsiella variicola]MDU2279558.1 hypothetical protein [Klebsiella sp.]HCD1367042.1 hypothetical protein [Klebsiella variicola subsp. variicola]